MFDRAKYEKHLRSRLLGRALTAVDEVDSTNRAVSAAAGAGAVEGTVIVAERQSGGRGRFGRSWASPKGGLWFSLLLRPDLNLVTLPAISILSGVVLIRTVGARHALPLHLGWPNDVVYDGRKLAGILVEGKVGESVAVVVGIGVNVNNDPDDLPAEFAGKATSLGKITGEKYDLEILLAEIINEYDIGYAELNEVGLEEIYTEWKAGLEMIGRAVTLSVDGKKHSGIVKDFTIDGGMILVCESGDELKVPLDRGTLISPKYIKTL
ncbi:MAG: biotin--[acetyl-CoA-carboxylase] ligase [bacterium]